MAEVLQHRSADEVVRELESGGFDAASVLPGLTLKSFALKRTGELIGKAELFLAGVAVDATGVIRRVPLLQGDIQSLELEMKVSAGEEIEYIGSGLPLFIPTASEFLAIRLFFIDSDKGIRASSNVVESIGELVASEEAIALLVLGGLSHAAAVMKVLGQAMNIVAAVMKANGDDLIAAFEGYFTARDLVAGEDYLVSNAGASAVFGVV